MEMTYLQVFTILFLMQGILIYCTVIREQPGMHPCVDFQGVKIEHGALYVPGPSVCSICYCYNSEPKWCSDTYCNPPKHCKNFRVGVRCCEYTCLDNKTKNWTDTDKLKPDGHKGSAVSNFNIFGKFYALLILMVTMMRAPMGPL